MATYADPEAVRVLVVDDEPILLEAQVLILRKSGIAADGVMSGREALDFVRDRSPEVVVLDVHLRDIDGLELAARISRKVPGVKILITTGDPTISPDSMALSPGVYDLLCKPIPPRVLISKIHEMAAGAPEMKRAA